MRSSAERASSTASPAAGPCTSASATARLSVTVGFGATRSSTAVEREDLRPVGEVGGRRLVVDGGDRGLELVGADRAARQAASVTRATPSAIASVSQSVRSCSLSGTSDPSGAGAGSAAGVGQQQEAQQPGRLAVRRGPAAGARAPAGSPRPSARLAAAASPRWPCSPR